MIQNLSIEKLQALCLTVQQCFPHSDVAICGGAPRDILNGKPVKDIDVFIQLNKDLEDWFNGCDKLGDILHSKWAGEDLDTDWMNSRGYAYGAFRLVDYPTGLRMHPVQLVFITEHPVENVARHFDFGLSQVWVTPNQLRMTRAYWHDHFHKRITYIASDEPNAQRRQSSRERLARLQEKYAGWRFERTGALAWDDRLDGPSQQSAAEPVHTFNPGSMVSRPMTLAEYGEVQKKQEVFVRELVVGGIYETRYEDAQKPVLNRWMGNGWSAGYYPDKGLSVEAIKQLGDDGFRTTHVRSVIGRIA